MKLTFVCLLLACVSLSSAQESSPWAGERVDVQRLFKFSGTLTDSQRAGFNVGAISVRFTMYKEPRGGEEAYWQETQNVRPDARGRFTVLLGETTPGGLPADIFASRGRYWLGVRASAQPEQPRILLVELPSTWKADPINPGRPPISKRTLLPSTTTEWYLALVLMIMFLVGTAMACGEVVKWWKTRTELYGRTPLATLLSSAPGPDKLRCTAEVLRFPLAEKFRSIRRRFQHSLQSIDIDKDRPKRVA